jgi:predicted O-methyltransferase YrrM
MMLATVWAAILSAAAASPLDDGKIQQVIDRVEKKCIERTVYMVGRPKAERLAELVRQRRPELVVECGTALGYSGLWIARELKKAGKGRLVTVEIDPETAREAEDHFREAGLADVVTVKIGDAREVVKAIADPVDFAFIDCGYSNYYPILKELEDNFRPGTVVVADNVGIGGAGMRDYLDRVRSPRYQTRTEWFEVDLPWAKRDAFEISVVKEQQGGARQ